MTLFFIQRKTETYQRGEGGQDGARLHTDEIIWDQTWRKKREILLLWDRKTKTSSASERSPVIHNSDSNFICDFCAILIPKRISSFPSSLPFLPLLSSLPTYICLIKQKDLRWFAIYIYTHIYTHTHTHTLQ